MGFSWARDVRGVAPPRQSIPGRREGYNVGRQGVREGEWPGMGQGREGRQGEERKEGWCMVLYTVKESESKIDRG